MTAKKLEQLNGNKLKFIRGEISIYVLGGLDHNPSTLKVTLKAEKETYFIRHTLDLYHHVQVEYYVQKLAEAIEITTQEARAVIYDLTQSLEVHRETTPEITVEPPEGKVKEKSVQFLSEPKLMERTNELLGKYGIVGEEKNRLLMYLIFMNCKQTNPLHIISCGQSGSGKTHLQSAVAELIPNEYKVETTALTGNALYYFGKNALKNKIVLVEDMDGANNALYALRELQTKQRVTKTIATKNAQGNIVATQVTTEGIITLAGCTTKTKLYEDNANRCFLIHLDDSREQDQRIMNYQKQLAAGKIDFFQKATIKELFHNNMRLLEPVLIINPFAELLEIPASILKPRRTIGHYLNAIAAVTYYHQYQRERKTRSTPHGRVTYIETTVEDIAMAHELIKEVLLEKTDALPQATRNYFKQLKGYLAERNSDTLTNQEVMRALQIPISTLKRYHKQLLQHGYIHIEATKARGAHQYQLTNQKANNVAQELDRVLTENIDRIKSLTGLPPAQFNHEPVKTQKTSQLAVVA